MQIVTAAEAVDGDLPSGARGGDERSRHLAVDEIDDDGIVAEASRIERPFPSRRIVWHVTSSAARGMSRLVVNVFDGVNPYAYEQETVSNSAPTGPKWRMCAARAAVLRVTSGDDARFAMPRDIGDGDGDGDGVAAGLGGAIALVLVESGALEGSGTRAGGTPKCPGQSGSTLRRSSKRQKPSSTS